MACLSHMLRLPSNHDLFKHLFDGAIFTLLSSFMVNIGLGTSSTRLIKGLFHRGACLQRALAL